MHSYLTNYRKVHVLKENKNGFRYLSLRYFIKAVVKEAHTIVELVATGKLVSTLITQ